MNTTFNQCLAENIKIFSAELIPYIEEKTNIAIDYDVSLAFEECRRQIVDGDIQFSWICGLLYTQMRDFEGGKLKPLVAPISNNNTEPSYSSYLVTQKTSTYQTEADLEGAILAFNETSSFSGYQLLRYHFRDSEICFSELVESGGHQKSIDLLSVSKVDLAAIDTTFYDYLTREKPEELQALRIIKPLDAFPMPPLLVHKNINSDIEAMLQNTLVTMHQDVKGKNLLQKHGFEVFKAVDDSYYDAIRNALQQAQDLKLKDNDIS